jgi:hypothetical protein
MLGEDSLSHQFASRIVIGGMIAFALGMLMAKAFFVQKPSPSSRPNTSAVLTDGFDFNPLRARSSIQ